jgi:hypothetical protein
MLKQTACKLIAPRRLKPLRRELADRLEHPEATRLPAADEAFVDERLQELKVCVGYLLCSLERPTASEDRERREQAALTGIEQLVRPLDRGAKRLLAPLRVAPAAQQVEAVGQPLEKLCCREKRRAGGRELERQRKIVELLAQLVHLLVRVEVRLDCARPRHEQLPRLRPREHRHRVDVLALHSQPLPARHQHVGTRALREHSRHLRRGLDEVLEVVEQEQEQ